MHKTGGSKTNLGKIPRTRESGEGGSQKTSKSERREREQKQGEETMEIGCDTGNSLRLGTA